MHSRNRRKAGINGRYFLANRTRGTAHIPRYTEIPAGVNDDRRKFRMLKYLFHRRHPFAVVTAPAMLPMRTPPPTLV
jgi:hypothetical protein